NGDRDIGQEIRHRLAEIGRGDDALVVGEADETGRAHRVPVEEAVGEAARDRVEEEPGEAKHEGQHHQVMRHMPLRNYDHVLKRPGPARPLPRTIAGATWPGPMAWGPAMLGRRGWEERRLSLPTGTCRGCRLRPWRHPPETGRRRRPRPP